MKKASDVEDVYGGVHAGMVLADKGFKASLWLENPKSADAIYCRSENVPPIIEFD